MQIYIVEDLNESARLERHAYRNIESVVNYASMNISEMAKLIKYGRVLTSTNILVQKFSVEYSMN